MPITNLQDLSDVGEGRLLLWPDTNVEEAIGAYAEFRRPEGVSNLFEAMRRISRAARAVYAYRLIQAQPDLRLPKGVLTEMMHRLHGELGQFRIMTYTFEAILNGTTPEDERLTLEETQQALQENAAAVNFLIAKEAWEAKKK